MLRNDDNVDNPTIIDVAYLKSLVELSPAMHIMFPVGHRQGLQVAMPWLQLLVQVELPPATLTLQAVV